MYSLSFSDTEGCRGTIRSFLNFVSLTKIYPSSASGESLLDINHSYDNNGNLISKDTVFYEYDELNKLGTALVGGHTNTYEYNGEDIKISKTVDGEISRYLYEGNKIIL